MLGHQLQAHSTRQQLALHYLHMHIGLTGSAQVTYAMSRRKDLGYMHGFSHYVYSHCVLGAAACNKQVQRVHAYVRLPAL